MVGWSSCRILFGWFRLQPIERAQYHNPNNGNMQLQTNITSLNIIFYMRCETSEISLLGQKNWNLWIDIVLHIFILGNNHRGEVNVGLQNLEAPKQAICNAYFLFYRYNFLDDVSCFFDHTWSPMHVKCDSWNICTYTIDGQKTPSH